MCAFLTCPWTVLVVAGVGGSAMTTDIKVVDITNDGIPDIVVAVNGGPNLLYPGEADGAGVDYPRATPIGVENENSQSVDVVDVDGDSDADVVFGNADGTATTYYNADGSLDPQPHKTGESDTQRGELSINAQVLQVVADFNGDGILDLLTGMIAILFRRLFCSILLRWMVSALLVGMDIVLGDGTGDFINGARLPYARDVEMPRAVTAADIDGDGDEDVIVSPGSDGPFGQNMPYAIINPGDGNLLQSETVLLAGLLPNRNTEVSASHSMCTVQLQRWPTDLRPCS